MLREERGANYLLKCPTATTMVSREWYYYCRRLDYSHLPAWVWHGSCSRAPHSIRHSSVYWCKIRTPKHPRGVKDCASVFLNTPKKPPPPCIHTAVCTTMRAPFLACRSSSRNLAVAVRCFSRNSRCFFYVPHLCRICRRMSTTLHFSGSRPRGHLLAGDAAAALVASPTPVIIAGETADEGRSVVAEQRPCVKPLLRLAMESRIDGATKALMAVVVGVRGYGAQRLTWWLRWETLRYTVPLRTRFRTKKSSPSDLPRALANQLARSFPHPFPLSGKHKPILQERAADHLAQGREIGNVDSSTNRTTLLPAACGFQDAPVPQARVAGGS